VIVALFDLDGTLYTGHMLQALAEHHRLHRTNRFYLYAFIGTHLALWPLWRSGLLSEEKMRELWVRDMAWALRGWSSSRAQEAFRWITQEYILPRLRHDVLEKLREHQTKGHYTILLSGTFAPLLAEVGHQLGIAETVGTPLIIRHGRYTGACEPPICQGEGKRQRLLARLQGREINWAESYAYADSYTDIPILELVGHPVAVYPDELLANHARERGWEIFLPSSQEDNSSPT